MKIRNLDNDMSRSMANPEVIVINAFVYEVYNRRLQQEKQK
jgi:hypothetical protein